MTLSFSSFDSNGELQLSFSSKMKPLNQFPLPKKRLLNDEFMNLTSLNLIKDNILELKYTSQLSKDNQNVPKLQNWLFKNFTEWKLILDLNFTNTLYVSSESGLSDIISIKVLENVLFQSQEGQLLED